MYTAKELFSHLEAMNIDRRGTLLVHSSMKAIGPVEGGADTVLDVLSDYMKDGLLLLPAHSWSHVGKDYPIFDALNEPSCVGLLTEMFRKRPGVIRSLHPTHSMSALGREAASFVSGEENAHSPCPRTGCWGKLYDRRATILFLGCSLKRNTFIHGVEEWNDVPNRLGKEPIEYTLIAPDGQRLTASVRPHHTEPPVTEVSQRYDKMEPAFIAGNAIRRGHFGDAPCVIGDAVRMADITTACLKRDIHLFDDDRPLPDIF